MSYAESVGMFELSRLNPKVHTIDKIAHDVIEAARLGAELLDGNVIRLPPSSDVWTTEVWEAMVDRYLGEEGIEVGQRFAVYLLNPDIVGAALGITEDSAERTIPSIPSEPLIPSRPASSDTEDE